MDMKQIINRRQVNSLIAASFLVQSLHPVSMHGEIISMRNEDFVCWVTKHRACWEQDGLSKQVSQAGEKQYLQNCKLWKSKEQSGSQTGRGRRVAGTQDAHDVHTANAKNQETCLG